RLGHRVGVLVRVQPHRHVQLRGAVRAQPAQIVPQRQVVKAGHCDSASENRAWTASPCAGRSSTFANVTTCAATSCSAALSYSTTWMRRRKVNTDRPEECRAQPPVGSTWLDPAQ